jgi:hypothetical protein
LVFSGPGKYQPNSRDLDGRSVAKRAAVVCRPIAADADLRALIEAWPLLSTEMRVSIAAIFRVCQIDARSQRRSGTPALVPRPSARNHH